ncbi:MAG: biotin/lipoyl-containing protein [Myxococcota bacterium]
MKARLKVREDGILELLAPAVGRWRGAPAVGSVVTPGGALGAVETLGRLTKLEAPARARGVVVEVFDPDHARSAVEWNTVLLRLDPAAAGADAQVSEQEEASAGGLVYRAPMAGRYYRRPSPDKDPFVEVGAELKEGSPVGLLEVMKTFNRIAYSGPPDRARVLRVLVEDGEDVSRGDALLELEAI